MSDVEHWGVLLPTLGWLLAGFWPRNLVDRRVVAWRRGLVLLAASHFVMTSVVLVSLGARQFLGAASSWSPAHLPLGLSVYLDGASALMAVLVAFVGLVVAHFSVRYLDGDPRQGMFLRDLALTVGAVSLFVVSGNLLQLWGAWTLTSWGLHRLLKHFPGRHEVRRAVGARFTVSRIGDVMLLAAVALVYAEWGTGDLATLFAVLPNQSSVVTPLVAWLVMLAAVTKSVQFPLHSWLPETLAAPTPVSALMHAGIVNAGGFLIIRLNPLVTASPAAMTALILIGSLTVGYGVLVMLTQSSVKGALAYSTIAQMGFMMLQCGLGAFSAAMLHILAHSLYKAYAFLNSGSVLTEASGRRNPGEASPLSVADFLGGLILASASLWVATLLLQIDVMEKPGGLVLGGVFSLALATWLWDVFRFPARRLLLSSLACGLGLAFAYLSVFRVVDALLGPTTAPAFTSAQSWLGVIGIATVFCGLATLDGLRRTSRGRDLLEGLYVHAMNGFYAEAWTRRLLRSLPSCLPPLQFRRA